MEKRFKYVALFVCCAAILFGASGCKPTVTIMPSLVTIDSGESVSLEATSTSDKDTSFVWSSNDPAIATVDQDGLVTGVNIGQTVVTAKGSSSGSEGLAEITVNRPADALSELSVTLDPDVVPESDPLPSFTDGGPPRPLAAIIDERGNQAEFVEDELILVTDDEMAVAEFTGRWGGEVLSTVDPGGSDIDMPKMHLVRINTALGDPTQLEADILALDPEARGACRVSSEAGLRLISAGAREAAQGLTVGMNWVSKGDSLATRYTTEGATGPDGFNSFGSGYSTNAFAWNYLNAGSTQNIGVTEAWYLLARTGRLLNKVKLAVLDMGFAVAGNDDMPPGWLGISNVPFKDPIGTSNLLSCTGGASCPWHGTNVVGAAMGMPDNNFGAAGPAGPVADPIMVFTLYDFFTSISALVEARVAGARVVNMSYGTPVPAIVAFTVLPFEIATAAAAHSMVLCASAGNNGKNVDAKDCFIVCWEETWWTPCENAGVLCVGGLAKNAKTRASNSNYGSGNVDIFAPYSVLVGPDPSSGPGAQQKNGTSFSAPYTAGVAALIIAAKPSLSADAVRNILISTAHSSPDNQVERYVNAYDAVSKALGQLIIITSPEPGETIHGGFPVVFDSFVNEDGHGTPSIAWTSNINGNLGTGSTISYSGLNYGTHTIQVTANFPDATSVQDEMTIIVANDPPTVNILSPLNGTSYYQGQPVLLAATSLDINEPGTHLTDAQISWYVDNVFIGHNHTRTIAAGTLSVGGHVIRVTGTDGTSSNSKTVSITTNPNPPDLPPDVVTIISPAVGDVTGPFFYDTGHYFNMELQGNAHDPEDGNLTGASLVWTRSINGGAAETLGTGENLTVKTYFGEGTTTYDVTLTATDSGGNASSVTHRATLVIIF